MRCSRLLPFVVASLWVSGAHAAHPIITGIITFHGTVTRETLIPSLNETSDLASLAATTTVLSLSSARKKLSSEVLDFFAGYAKPDARFISVTYK
jgi:hypothetical protein